MTTEGNNMCRETNVGGFVKVDWDIKAKDRRCFIKDQIHTCVCMLTLMFMMVFFGRRGQIGTIGRMPRAHEFCVWGK